MSGDCETANARACESDGSKQVISRRTLLNGILFALSLPALVGTMISGAYAENCRNGVCVSGSYDGTQLNVTYRATSPTVTRVYIKRNGETKLVVGPQGKFHFTVNANTCKPLRYALQACATPAPGKQMCFADAQFSHPFQCID